MPEFSAAIVVEGDADRLFDCLVDGERLTEWGSSRCAHSFAVHHRAGPRTGEGATYRVLERLDDRSTANYELTIADCERPRHVALRSPSAYDTVFEFEHLDPELIRLTCTRSFHDDSAQLLARMFALEAETEPEPVIEQIEADLQRIAALFGAGLPSFSLSEDNSAGSPTRM